MSNKNHVFKVFEAEAWSAARQHGSFAGSPDDVRDGFVHLSCAHQLAGTLAKHYRNRSNLILVAFDTAALGPSLKFEVSRGGDLFPHLYGPLPTGLALWHRPLRNGPDGVPIIEEAWFEEC